MYPDIARGPTQEYFQRVYHPKTGNKPLSMRKAITSAIQITSTSSNNKWNYILGLQTTLQKAYGIGVMIVLRVTPCKVNIQKNSETLGEEEAITEYLFLRYGRPDHKHYRHWVKTWNQVIRINAFGLPITKTDWWCTLAYLLAHLDLWNMATM